MKRQLAKNKMSVYRVGGNAANGDKKAKRDRKVEMRAFLDQIGWRQVDGNPLWRQRQTD